MANPFKSLRGNTIYKRGYLLLIILINILQLKEFNLFI
jgi:hypothetical protein